ncbi:MAG: acyl-CoA dehydrogenase family protein [Novosphingobium sp.]|uniref:acyl-CoA dehydrogenase family protein n=1 Tax=Novosphingobium sp. TaxID=1874826 RepID=UPI0027340048|nr:acyl-CoA dehydrogenase family protein [Novosphingobium sp.]MDP3549878.1 acyl-CoA dehydrogenase family protein [Novosphingobium sp.]
MNFDLNEDEEMLKALAERFVEDNYDLDRRRQYLGGPNGFSPQMWALLAELGLIAAPLAEESGGLALDATAIATVFEALGKGIVAEPLIENVMVAARLFERVAPDALKAQWMEALAMGSRRLALAHAEQGSRGGSLWVATKAGADGSLTGVKSCVPAGAGVDGYIVSARESGAEGDPAGVALFLVAADAPGLVRTAWRTVDGALAVSLELNGAPALRLGGSAADVAANETLASLARSAEALGIMQGLFDATLDYLRTRQQFGATLGSFQAIQHRMAAQYAAIEQARALLNLAIVSQGSDRFASAVDGLRAFIAPASVELGHEMIQFHGGMGVTDELMIGHGHKRLLMLSRWPDDPQAALDRFAGVV